MARILAFNSQSSITTDMLLGRASGRVTWVIYDDSRSNVCLSNGSRFYTKNPAPFCSRESKNTPAGSRESNSTLHRHPSTLGSAKILRPALARAIQLSTDTLLLSAAQKYSGRLSREQFNSSQIPFYSRQRKNTPAGQPPAGAKMR